MYQHLFVFANCETLSLYHLQVLKATEDVMLDFEGDLHPELCAFLDAERLLFKCLESTRRRQIDGDIRSSFDLQGKCMYNAAALV